MYVGVPTLMKDHRDMDFAVGRKSKEGVIKYFHRLAELWTMEKCEVDNTSLKTTALSSSEASNGKIGKQENRWRLEKSMCFVCETARSSSFVSSLILPKPMQHQYDNVMSSF